LVTTEISVGERERERERERQRQTAPLVTRAFGVGSKNQQR
jgi:hypothetical protein